MSEPAAEMTDEPNYDQPSDEQFDLQCIVCQQPARAALRCPNQHLICCSCALQWAVNNLDNTASVQFRVHDVDDDDGDLVGLACQLRTRVELICRLANQGRKVVCYGRDCALTQSEHLDVGRALCQVEQSTLRFIVEMLSELHRDDGIVTSVEQLITVADKLRSAAVDKIPRMFGWLFGADTAPPDVITSLSGDAATIAVEATSLRQPADDVNSSLQRIEAKLGTLESNPDKETAMSTLGVICDELDLISGLLVDDVIAATRRMSAYVMTAKVEAREVSKSFARCPVFHRLQTPADLQPQPIFLRIVVDCPLCRQHGALQPSPDTDRAVASMSVRCPTPGCTWAGCYSDYWSHVHRIAKRDHSQMEEEDEDDEEEENEEDGDAEGENDQSASKKWKQNAD